MQWDSENIWFYKLKTYDYIEDVLCWMCVKSFKQYEKQIQIRAAIEKRSIQFEYIMILSNYWNIKNENIAKTKTEAIETMIYPMMLNLLDSQYNFS